MNMPYTAKCHYNTVQFITILHTELRCMSEWESDYKTITDTPHLAPMASYGVSIMRIFLEN